MWIQVQTRYKIEYVICHTKSPSFCWRLCTKSFHFRFIFVVKPSSLYNSIIINEIIINTKINNNPFNISLNENISSIKLFFFLIDNSSHYSPIIISNNLFFILGINGFIEPLNTIFNNETFRTDFCDIAVKALGTIPKWNEFLPFLFLHQQPPFLSQLLKEIKFKKIYDKRARLTCSFFSGVKDVGNSMSNSMIKSPLSHGAATRGMPSPGTTFL